MLRLLLYIIALLTASVFLARVVDMPGSVELQWMGWQAETTPLFLLFLIGCVLMLVVSLFWLISAAIAVPGKYRNNRRIEYHERGLSAVTEAIAALSVSDIPNAKKLTKRAEKMLGSTPIVHLLAAQLARIEGEDNTATQHLKRLLDFKETQFLAARGLLEQARKTGDVDTAVAYAQEAGNIRPDSSFAALSMVDLYTRQQRWQLALEVIRRAQKHHALTSHEAARYRALIEHQHGKYLYEHEDYQTAYRYAKEAHKTLPDMVPAAVLLAEVQGTLGKRQAATATLRNTWKLVPHPSLLQAYKRLLTGETAAARAKLVEKLVSVNPEEMETYLALAEVNYEAGNLAKAHINAQHALNVLETPRACLLMAEIEDAQQRPEKAEKWRQRASKALSAPEWTCENCKHVTPEWKLHCPECDAFDAIHWRLNRLHYVEDGPKVAPAL